MCQYNNNKTTLKASFQIKVCLWIKFNGYIMKHCTRFCSPIHSLGLCFQLPYITNTDANCKIICFKYKTIQCYKQGITIT